MKSYRNNGAIGALLDEYEKAVAELKTAIAPIGEEDLCCIVDHQTTDEDCRSIQNILAHVVRAGYCYVIEIRRKLGEELDFVERNPLDNAAAYQIALDDMFAYNVALFDDYPNLQIETYDNEQKMLVRWGQRYDVEQLFEHAIVHVLRHRRQIERFLLLLKK